MFTKKKDKVLHQAKEEDDEAEDEKVLPTAELHDKVDPEIK